MTRMIFIIIALTFILPVSEGFAEMKKSRLEMDYGTSFRLAIFNQVLNADAEKNLEPVYGLDGRAAASAIGNYQKSFGFAKEKPVFMLNVGEGK